MCHPFFLDVCAGAGALLSTALHHLGVSTLAIDPLIDSRVDLRDDAFFDHLLRICASKSVALRMQPLPAGSTLGQNSSLTDLGLSAHQMPLMAYLAFRPRLLGAPSLGLGSPALSVGDALKPSCLSAGRRWHLLGP